MVVRVRQSNPGWVNRLLRRYREQSVLAVGWPKGTDAAGIKYPDGVSVVSVAIDNNFGSSSRRIPARPFMTTGQQPAIEATQPVAEAMIPAVNQGRATVEDVLRQMGPFAAAAFQKAITDLATPPNSPVTIAAKGSSNPLIDTGLMRNSLTWAVVRR